MHLSDYPVCSGKAEVPFLSERKRDVNLCFRSRISPALQYAIPY